MNGFDPRAVVEAVRAALDGRPKAILHGHLPFQNPDELALRLAQGATDVTWVRLFEEAIAKKVGVGNAVATSSGTAALHLALAALSVGDRTTIPVPALTFAAVAAAVRYCGAKPKFYDMPEDARGAWRAVIGVDLLGLPGCSELKAMKDTYPGILIEDAAQALGSFDAEGRACGSIGDISILSFNLNKVVTTGGGGMLLTNNPEITARARYLASQAKIKSEFFYDHSEVGFNYRMAVPAAIVGLSSLENLDRTLSAKSRLHARYAAAFQGLRPGVELVEAPAGVVWNHWLNAIEVPPGERDPTMDALAKAGYECRALFTPLPWVGPYVRFSSQREAYPEAEYRFQRTICLPSGPELAA